MLSITQFVTGKIRDHETHHNSQRKIIITGGPGVGKSSIMHCLTEFGFNAVPEAAADISREELKKGTSEPWLQPWFEDRVIRLQEDRYREAVAKLTQHVFFDRGPIDPMTYKLRLCLEPNSLLIGAVQKAVDEGTYDKTVFFIDHLGFTDQVDYRVETIDTTIVIGKDLKRNYKRLGYTIIRIPAFPELDKEEAIKKRTRLILEHCGIVITR